MSEVGSNNQSVPKQQGLTLVSVLANVKLVRRGHPITQAAVSEVGHVSAHC